MTELKKYPSISRIGHEDNNGILEDGHLVVKEKMDGANFRFTYYPEEDRIVFGSRNIEYWNDGNQFITDRERRWFKEMHSTQSVSDPDEYEPSDAEVLARKFTTEARVLKLIHKYENRGRTIEMPIMEDLWEDVFEDIIEEEFKSIFLGKHTIDTKEFRSEVAGITADVLQSYLERPDDSVLNQVTS